MTRTRALIATAIAVLAVAAAGCGGDDNGSSSSGSEDISGSISIMGIWTAEEQDSFQAVIDGFTEQYPNVTVKYTSAGDNIPTVLSTAVEGGNPPDIADIAQPGFLADLAAKGALKPITFAEDTIVENFGQAVADVGTVDGTLYGLPWKSSNKSTVWYNVQAFDDAGVEPAETWDDFLSAADTVKASGLPPYSIAGANGWTLTDLFENIYIRSAGLDKYNQLSKHEIPWTDESVTTALEDMVQVVGSSDNMAGGTSGALQTDFPTSVGNVLTDSPKAAMVIEGAFVPGAVDTTLEAGTGYDVFTFPSIDDSVPSVVTSGDIMILFTDNPATQAFFEYLASPESAEIWAERGGFASPNKKLDTSVYPDELTQTTAGAIGTADAFAFDLSDLQPASFGATEGQGLWKLFQDLIQNPDDIQGIQQQMEQAATQAYK